MSTRPRNEAARGRLYELLCVLAVTIVAGAWSCHIQQFRVVRYWDADEYFKLSEQLASGLPVTVEAPFAYRILTPWIVARCCGDDIQRGYLIVNIIVGAMGALLLMLWLRRFVGDWRVRALLVAAYAFEWHGPVRFVYYNPVYVDPAFIVFLLLGLLLIERIASSTSRWDLAAFTAVAFLGTACREVMLLLPLCALAHPQQWQRIGRAERAAWLASPLAAAVVALALVRSASIPRGAYSFAGAAAYHLTHKPVFSAALTWFMTFGPMIALVVYDWRAAARFLGRHRHLGLYLAGIAVLAYFGGHDTERYLFWAMPVVYVLVGTAIERNTEVLSSTALAATLAGAQAISERIFWPVPDPGSAVASWHELPTLAAKTYSALNRLFVVDDFHWNLWSNFGSRPFHLLLLGLYVAFSAAVVAWMRSREVTVNASRS